MKSYEFEHPMHSVRVRVREAKNLNNTVSSSICSQLYEFLDATGKCSIYIYIYIYMIQIYEWLEPLQL
jgi:hypothetical protein